VIFGLRSLRRLCCLCLESLAFILVVVRAFCACYLAFSLCVYSPRCSHTTHLLLSFLLLFCGFFLRVGLVPGVGWLTFYQPSLVGLLTKGANRWRRAAGYRERAGRKATGGGELEIRELRGGDKKRAWPKSHGPGAKADADRHVNRDRRDPCVTRRGPALAKRGAGERARRNRRQAHQQFRQIQLQPRVLLGQRHPMRGRDR